MEASRVSARLDRKTVEKNRRIHMKALCAKLVSLLPASASQVSLSGETEEITTIRNVFPSLFSLIGLVAGECGGDAAEPTG